MSQILVDGSQRLPVPHSALVPFGQRRGAPPSLAMAFITAGAVPSNVSAPKPTTAVLIPLARFARTASTVPSRSRHEMRVLAPPQDVGPPKVQSHVMAFWS